MEKRSVHVLIRRLHLYLALSLLPWFFMYAVSSLPFSHPSFLQPWYADGKPDWTLVLERPYQAPPLEEAEAQGLARQILQDLGLDRSYGVYLPRNDQLQIYLPHFRFPMRIVYLQGEERLRVEEKRFRWDHFLTGLHARGGFQHSSLLDDAWALLVDLVCLGILLWVGTGLYMWWLLPQVRRWGFLVLGAGTGTFLLLLVL